jgi:hypothetical protein
MPRVRPFAEQAKPGQLFLAERFLREISQLWTATSLYHPAVLVCV